MCAVLRKRKFPEYDRLREAPGRDTRRTSSRQNGEEGCQAERRDQATSARRCCAVPVDDCLSPSWGMRWFRKALRLRGIRKSRHISCSSSSDMQLIASTTTATSTGLRRKEHSSFWPMVRWNSSASRCCAASAVQTGAQAITILINLSNGSTRQLDRPDRPNAKRGWVCLRLTRLTCCIGLSGPRTGKCEDVRSERDDGWGDRCATDANRHNMAPPKPP
jgi:hypothetical protein